MKDLEIDQLQLDQQQLEVQAIIRQVSENQHLVSEEQDHKLDQSVEEQTMRMIMVFGARKQPKSTIRIETPHQLSELRELELLRKTWKLQVTTVIFLLQELIHSSHAQLSPKRVRQDSHTHRFRWVLMRAKSPISSQLIQYSRSIMIRKMSYLWKRADKTKYSQQKTQRTLSNKNLMLIAR